MTDTSDTSWSTRVEDWQRLRWAREKAALRQEDMARMVNISRTAYLKYETNPDPDPTKHTDISVPNARVWAKRLKVSWLWLVIGHPYTPFDEELSPDAISLGRDVDRIPEEQRKAKVEAIRALLTGTGS